MRSGIIPGLHDDAHALAFFAGRDRLRAAGGPRRCASSAKHGGPCGGWALRGLDYCTHHAPAAAQRERRMRLLHRPKTPAQMQRALRRESARVQRIAWKHDRWTPGSTVTLGPREEALQVQLCALGFKPDRFSPATLDAVRWAWLNYQAGRMTVYQFCDRVRWHVAKD